jgi:CheY-like chemotaxis protein
MPHALIIDDNNIGIQVLSQFLVQAQVSYVALQDAVRINELIADLDQFDVIFLDLEMPGLDGYNLLKFLKEEMRLSAPIIAHSVHSNEMLEARKMGFDGFLGKPIQKTRFPGQLQRILNREPMWEAD